MESNYSQIDDESRTSSSEYSKEDALLGGEYRGRPHPKSWREKPSMNFTGIVLAVSLLVVSNIATALSVRSHFTGPPGTLTETSVFSPVHKMVKLPLVDKMIDRAAAANASNPDHVFRLPPSPEVDAAWDKITDIPMFPISREDVLKIKKDPEISVIPPEHWGMGTDEHGDPNYLMEVDVFHQLHCLNAIRKGLINNYDYYWGQKFGFVPPVNFERHMNHCIDILRQTLMCHADVEAVVFNWRETQIRPYPDFGVHRKCKDWDTLMDWSEKNKMPDMVHRFDVFTKPEGVKQIPAPPHMSQEGEDGTVKAPPELGVPFIQPLTGLAGVEYCMGANNKTRS